MGEGKRVSYLTSITTLSHLLSSPRPPTVKHCVVQGLSVLAAALVFSACACFPLVFRTPWMVACRRAYEINFPATPGFTVPPKPKGQNTVLLLLLLILSART